jgi:hypothetical protein
MPPEGLVVVDDVLPDPEAYRAMALAQPFGSVTIGGATFHGIAACPDTALRDWLAARCEVDGPVTTFFRQSPAGQLEPNYIHTDQDMGAWTAILYLNPTPQAGDGTAFWQRKDTGARESAGETIEELLPEWLAWREPDLWERWATVEAKFNRVVLFPAPYFHSRALFENYGQSSDDARLIQVLFGGTDVRRH